MRCQFKHKRQCGRLASVKVGKKVFCLMHGVIESTRTGVQFALLSTLPKKKPTA